MTAAALHDLVAYSCAVSSITVGAWLVTAWARVQSPKLLLTFFQAALAAATLLPLVSLFAPPRPGSEGMLPMIAFSTTAATGARPAVAVATGVALVIVAGALLRLTWLALGCMRLRTWRKIAAPLDPLPPTIREIERLLDVHARWYISGEVTSAATYGLWRPVVLLPQRDAAGAGATLRLVAWHELLHVRRRDWLFVLVEECVQAVLWFQPAVWFLVDRIRLFREQVVDQGVVAATDASQHYARALIEGTGTAWTIAPRPASQWSRARHLRLRIQAILKGATMTTRAVATWTCVFALTLAVAAYSAMRAFPLQASSNSQSDRHVYSSDEPGVVLPTVVRSVKPQYTQEAIDAHIEGFVRLAIVVETDGSVSDVTITESLDPTFGLDDEAVKAARQWAFRPATKDGKPVPVRVELQLRFLLK